MTYRTCRQTGNLFRGRSAAARQRDRCGFSQVEVAMSVLLTGLIITASLNVTGYATRGQVQNNGQMRARLVASGLLAEILELPFADPTQSPVFGTEPGETSNPATRSLFDDVDDYHNWSSTAQTKAGTAIADAADLTTTVFVEFANPSQLGNGAPGPNSADVKRVTVKVLRGSMIVAELIGIVTR